ncbi:MAG: hypothetical protein M1459_01165 [Patescibacteria group bacterium]|nr:hypothetical protein [Patescibacteria group bacterium]
MFSKKNQKYFALICVFSLAFAIGAPFTNVAQAQEGAASSAIAVPISTGLDYNSTMKHLKDFTLDRIATMVARQILHQMTVSVVNWINSGFEGNPSFITNPEAFFLDVGDQLTGAFIAQTGVLSRLCSPFNLDIRLALALGQSQLVDQRYACTLSTVINNAKNARANVTLTSSPNGATLGDIMSGDVLSNPNQVSINGNSVDATKAFLEGDFSQGGWEGFMALTMDPRNNPSGAYLMAQADLQSRIEARKGQLNSELNRGSGFLSWKKCDTITELNPGATSNSYYLSDPRYTVDMHKDGSATVKYCQTQTPGSVISSSLQKQLGSTVDELDLANNINAIIDALVSQLVTKVLTNGLASVSSTAGGRVSFTNQIQANTQTMVQQQTIYTQTQAANITTQSIEAVNQYKGIYDQAVNIMSESANRLETARNCFLEKSAQPQTYSVSEISYANRQISLIDADLNIVNPFLTILRAAQYDAQSKISKIDELNRSAGRSASAYNSADLYSQAVQAAISANNDATSRMPEAEQDLAKAQKEAPGWNTKAASYQSACNNFQQSAMFYLLNKR